MVQPEVLSTPLRSVHSSIVRRVKALRQWIRAVVKNERNAFHVDLKR